LQERIRRVLRKGYINKDLYDIFEDRAIKTMYLLDRTKQSLEIKKEKGNNKMEK